MYIRFAIKLSANQPAKMVLGIEINQGTTLNIQPFFNQFFVFIKINIINIVIIHFKIILQIQDKFLESRQVTKLTICNTHCFGTRVPQLTTKKRTYSIFLSMVQNLSNYCLFVAVFAIAAFDSTKTTSLHLSRLNHLSLYLK